MTAREPLRSDLGAHLLVHRDAHSLIEVALWPCQFEWLQNFGLWRQIGGDEALRPAQQKWLQSRRQHATPLRILLFLDRDAEYPAEPLGVAE